jgi:hypothetical protein
LRFAQLGCERVFVVGRNETLAKGVVESIQQAGAQGGFVKADLSSIGGIRNAAGEIAKLTGSKGVDYMVMTQGGPPNGVYKASPDGIDVSFAVQCLSRFGLAYLLSSNKTINEGGAVVSVAAPGSTWEVDLDDLDLKKKYGTGRYAFLHMVDQGRNDSVVLDSVTEELNARFPKTRFYHLFPGIVKSNALINQGAPFPLPQLWSVFGGLVATPAAKYSNIPVFVAAHPDAKKTIGDATRLNHNLKPLEMCAWGKNQDNRNRLWDKLAGWIGNA